MKFFYEQDSIRDLEQATKLEWLETNGLGGWASSSIVNQNTRRYHGLLIAALDPPVQRVVLLSKLDETIIINDERFELGCNRYADGTVHPKGYLYLQSFTKDLYPTFLYQVQDVVLQKSIVAKKGEDTTLIKYEVLKAPQPFKMELVPLVSGRNYHWLGEANDELNKTSSFKNATLNVSPYQNTRFFINVPDSSFVADSCWYYSFHYQEEFERGLNCHEDLFSYGKFEVSLKEGDEFVIIVSRGNPTGRDGIELFNEEVERRRSLRDKVDGKEPLLEGLLLAADQFVVQKQTDLWSIIAGYHWFTDWGRDTMIALPGLCLVTGEFDKARGILKAFAGSVSQGMLPNRFPDEDQVPEYNNVDATLWFFVAAYKYYQYTEDKQFMEQELLPVMEDIIKWHYKGTRYNIVVDKDELLIAGEEGVQLTWMDAKVETWVVTPRIGKVVEVNALWYNALQIFSYFLSQKNEYEKAETFAAKAAKAKESFLQLFWNEEKQYLYDYVNGEVKDDTIRPNQLFSLSLPFPLVNEEQAKSVLNLVEKELVTPFGLRTLSPRHPDYKGIHGGNQWQRDGAYHQGTVWSWLLGPYIDALMIYREDEGKEEAKKFLKSMKGHLKEAGIGSISEIFDGDAPHKPKGCIAQAWSVSELLRVIIEHDLLDEKAVMDRFHHKARIKQV